MIQITSPWFCAGVILQNGRVIRCAPIIKYMLNWTEAKVFRYAATRKWTATRHD